jgi:hypothetical protein
MSSFFFLRPMALGQSSKVDGRSWTIASESRFTASGTTGSSSAFLRRGAAKSACGEYDGECLLYHSLSSAMAQSSTKRSAAQGEQASGRVQGQPTHLVWQLAAIWLLNRPGPPWESYPAPQLAFCFGGDEGRSRAHEPEQRGITKWDDRASAIAILYQTCKTLRKQLSDDGFCMRTFSLCRALADGNSPQTLQRVEATIRRQLRRLPDQDERAWWLDARSLVQRCRENYSDRTGERWSWLQAASQEPDGPLSRQAAATARMLGWHVVRWPDKPRVRFPGLWTLTGHSREVTSVAYSPDGIRIISGSEDKTVKVWNAATGKEVRQRVLPSLYRLLLRALMLTCEVGP